MRTYRFRLQFWVFISFFVLIFAGIIALHITLAASKTKITQQINKELAHQLSIGKIDFFLPNNLILRDIAVFPKGSSHQKFFIIPKITLKFSLWDLILKRELVISKTIIHKPEINFDYFCIFLKENYQEIVSYIASLPKMDFNFVIQKAEFDVTKEIKSPETLATSFTLAVKKDSFLVAGWMRLDTYEGRTKTILRGSPLGFDLKALLSKEGLTIEQLILKKQNLFTQVWGNYKESILQLNGFAFMDTRPKKQENQESTLSILKRINRFLHGPKEDYLEQGRTNIFVLDIDSRVYFALPTIEIQRLWFTLNSAPVGLKGWFKFGEHPVLNLKVAYYPGRSRLSKFQVLKEAFLNISGSFGRNELNSSGDLNLYFKDEKASTRSPQRVEVQFKDLKFPIYRQPIFKTSLLESQITFLANDKEHQLSLRDLNAVVNFKMRRLKFVELDSRLGDGSLQGRIWLDTFLSPMKVTASLFIKNTNANELKGLLIHFSKVKGKLFSRIYYSNYPEFILNGSMNMQNGSLSNFEFFQWLAETFALPSLKKIDFTKATMYFLVNTTSSGLYNIDLTSDDVKLSGFYSVDKNSLVSSKISLDFSRRLMRESPKFIPILKMFGKGVESLNFNFQLSGNEHAMNFQWLSSDAKKRIQEKIPNFIERIIERKIGKSIESQPEAEQKIQPASPQP